MEYPEYCGRCMRHSDPPEPLIITETPTRLTIHCRGEKDWGRALLLTGGTVLGLLLLLLSSVYLLLTAKPKDDLPLILVICLFIDGLLLVYYVWAAFTESLDALLEFEQLTLEGHTLSIEKSGLGPIRLTTHYTLNGRTWFYTFPFVSRFGSGRACCFSRSRLLAHIHRSCSVHWFHPADQRVFCRGVAFEETNRVIELIIARCPDCHHLRPEDPLLGPG